MSNPILMTDFYKLCHMMQFREEITGFVSYLVPRGNRTSTFKGWTIFGIQKFCKDLQREFNCNFFGRPWDEVASEIRSVLIYSLSYKENLLAATLRKIKELYNVGYLPITINALPEGTEVPIGCPAVEIIATEPSCPWVGQAIESWLSCALWHPSMSATVAKEYAKIAKKAYDKTVDNGNYQNGFCDFSLRGQESYESAVASAAGWLTSMRNSSTVGAREWIEDNYCDEYVRIGGLTSTEHSVMTSDYAITGDERETYKRLLTEVYPHVSFAAVCDSYDFWNVLTNILPTLKDEIEAHEGFLGVRHDSAEPVSALCGLPIIPIKEDDEITSEDWYLETALDCEYLDYEDGEANVSYRFVGCGIDKVVTFEPEWSNERGAYTDQKHWFIENWCIAGIRDTTWEDKGMVETMYELFGGTINSKGYKVMNPKLKAVYGDSITIQRAKAIFERLEEKDFAANNVSLGVGSFSMECIEENGELKPFTRDTFSIAIKATAARITQDDGTSKWIAVYKDPKNFSQKKSIKGLALVLRDKDGKLYYQDEVPIEKYEEYQYLSQLETYFEDGHASNSKLFNDIRKRVEV